MNQRIRLFAEQATTYIEPVPGHSGEGWIFDKEKFAQLIVRECSTICKDIAEKQFSPLYSRESDGATICYKKIKEHFGVEE